MPPEAHAIAIPLALGGLVQGCSGFGLSMVAVPLLLVTLSPLRIVAIMTCVSVVSNVMIIKEAPRALRPDLLAPLGAGAALGIPVGLTLARTLDPHWTKLGIGLVVTAVSLVLITGRTPPRSDTVPARLGVGALSGILNGSVATGGPPLLLFLASHGYSKDAFKVNLGGYFFILNAVTITLLIQGDLIPATLGTDLLAGVPALTLGTWLGIRIGRALDEGRFRRLTLGLILTLGTLLSVTNLLALTGVTSP